MNRNKRTEGPSQSGVSSQLLFANLQKGFHAVAQPLAILRASLGSDIANGMSLTELQDLAASSAREVERVCALFSCMQQMVGTAAVNPCLSATSIIPLLTNAVDGVDLLFEEDGMFLSSTIPDECDPVLIDGKRTLQALCNVLLTAHSVSRAEHTIELIAASSCTGVRVEVRNASSTVDALNAELTLSMALAEANMRSQRAGFEWGLKPFSVRIDLPKAPPVHYC